MCDDDDVGIGSLVDAKRFSKIQKLLRVSAYILRFVWNLRSKMKDETTKTGPLTTKEMNEAKTLWLKYDQSFIKNSTDFSKTKHSLNLFEDDYGLLRSRTRISGVETVDFNRKCPILLRKKSQLTKIAYLASPLRSLSSWS